MCGHVLVVSVYVKKKCFQTDEDTSGSELLACWRIAMGKKSTFSIQLSQVLRWSLWKSHVISLFWHCCKWDTFLKCQAAKCFALIWFLKCFPCQHGATCQQSSEPFMMHFFLSVKYRGALLHRAYEVTPCPPELFPNQLHASYTSISSHTDILPSTETRHVDAYLFTPVL